MNTSFGAKPWHQTSWDFRAAFNFRFGGAGAGLLLIVALSGLGGDAMRAELLLGMALMGAGLVSVWFEIGRPLRAMNVGFNPFTSWMTRESFAAGAVFVLGLAEMRMEADIELCGQRRGRGHQRCRHRKRRARRQRDLHHGILAELVMLCHHPRTVGQNRVFVLHDAVRRQSAVALRAVPQADGRRRSGEGTRRHRGRCEPR